MTYQFVYTRRAERNIDKLDAATQKRIKKKIDGKFIADMSPLKRFKKIHQSSISINISSLTGF